MNGLLLNVSEKCLNEDYCNIMHALLMGPLHIPLVASFGITGLQTDGELSLSLVRGY